jgi:hypothetical protein
MLRPRVRQRQPDVEPAYVVVIFEESVNRMLVMRLRYPRLDKLVDDDIGFAWEHDVLEEICVQMIVYC